MFVNTIFRQDIPYFEVQLKEERAPSTYCTQAYILCLDVVRVLCFRYPGKRQHVLRTIGGEYCPTRGSIWQFGVVLAQNVVPPPRAPQTIRGYRRGSIPPSRILPFHFAIHLFNVIMKHQNGKMVLDGQCDAVGHLLSYIDK